MPDRQTAWERSMHPDPSVPSGLSHFAAELFGSLFVVASTFGLIAAVVLMAGGTQGGAADRLTGLILAVVAVPLFMFGRYLVVEHAVSHRKPTSGGGRGGSGPAAAPPPAPQRPTTLQERHVAARRSPLHNPPSRQRGRHQPEDSVTR